MSTLNPVRGTDGVFDYLVDQIAFIDRIDLSVWGKRRKKPKDSVSIPRHFSIGGPGRLYGHSNHGICGATCNRFEQRYGVLKWPRSVPPNRVILYSNGTPLSCAHVDLVLDALMVGGCRSRISRVELTFDLSEPSVGFFRRHVVTAAKKFTWRANARGESFISGTRNSGWQLIVYDKKPFVRCEFILRRLFLRGIGINRPHEVVRLRTLGLERLVRIREPDRSRLDMFGPYSGYAERAIRSWAERLSTQKLVSALRTCGRSADDWLKPCAVETRLRGMQRRLLW